LDANNSLAITALNGSIVLVSRIETLSTGIT